MSCAINWDKYHPGEHLVLYLNNESESTIYYERIIMDDDKNYNGSDTYQECFSSITPFYHSVRGILNPRDKGVYLGEGVRILTDRYLPSCEDRLIIDGPVFLGIFYPHPGLLVDEDCAGVYKLTYEVLDTLLQWEASFPFPEEVERFTIEEFREYSGYEYFTKIPPKWWGKEYDDVRPDGGISVTIKDDINTY